MWRAILTTLLFLLCAPADTRQFLHGSGAGTAAAFTPQWQALANGAGGQITSLDYHIIDGTTLIRTDTYGAYLYRATGSCTGWGNTFAAPCWEQVVTINSVPSATFAANPNNFPTEAGVVEIVACDSNTNVGYMLWEGFLYVTQNLQSASRTWLKTTQTTTQAPNGGPKDFGHFIACDPNNPAIAIIGTGAGAFQTINGTAGLPTFARLSAITNPTGSGTIVVAYDPASSVVGGVTQHFMICSDGQGCYETTNGGGNLTKTTSTPTTFKYLICDKFSQFWMTDATTTLHKYVSSWASITLPGNGQGIAIDPNSASVGANKIAVSLFGGGHLMTNATNGTGAWNGPDFSQTQSASGAQPGWLNTANQVSAGVIQFNTLQIVYDSSSNILAAGGLGVWTTPAPVAVVATPWSSNNVGIEQLVPNQILVAPGVAPMVMVWDKGAMPVFNPDVFPSIYWNNSTSLNPIMGGWAADYVPGTVGFAVVWESSNLSGQSAPATTVDGGHNFTPFANTPSLNGLSFGSIAASTTTNWLLHPACDGCAGGTRTPLYYTLNGATTAWNTVTISGTPSFEVNQGFRFPLAADRVTAGAYCIVDVNLNFYATTNVATGFGSPVATIANVDGGANADMLRSVPGQAGTYMYTSAGNTSTHLWKNTNSCVGANWVSCDSSFTNVLAFGFGATASGSGFPLIYAVGIRSGVYGIYVSANSCATFALINAPASQQNWARGTIDFISWIDGSLDIYGLVLVGHRGSDSAYIQLTDACPYVNWSNIKPTDVVSGTMSISAQGLKSGSVPATSVDFLVDGSLIGTQTIPAGTPPTYTQNWNTTGLAAGPHNLTVRAVGNGCTVNSNSFTIPVTK